ncbi:MAG: 7TM domain-containing protein, partial [Verrucomicrobiales bacterium]|nr:7TM domain-containing protein [Verrucomicrobiales bacterium]
RFITFGLAPNKKRLALHGSQPTSAPSEVRATRKAGFADVFELTRLPLGIQKTLELVLLLPLGALVTALFRNIIGVMTFGTFGPTLLALAFIFADWKTGIAMAVVILSVGLLVRHLIDPLRLLLVPRLGVILTMVVVSTIMAVSVTDYLGWTTEGQSVLLPMVILTGLIERIFTTVEEEGTGPTAKRVGGTLIVGFCCYLLLSSKTTGHLILVYPELHFFTVAAMVWTGRYAGYRLSELLRFADLGEKMATPGERRQ